MQHDYSIRDAVLTPKGKEQCRALSKAFPFHNNVDIVFASPLRRTIQTAALSLGPTLLRKDVPFVLLPSLQEIGDVGSDTGLADTGEDLKRLLPELFAQEKLEFDLEKIDASAVRKGWNSKVSLTRNSSCMWVLTNIRRSKATGPMRRRPFRNVRPTSATGCFIVLRHKYVRLYRAP